MYKAFGRARVWAALVQLAVPGMMVWIGLATRDQFKSLLIGKLFPGAVLEHLTETGRLHAEQIRSLFRPAALARISWHKLHGHKLIMVSASLNFYLEPTAKRLGFDALLCTEVVAVNGVCTGEMRGQNCRAVEKVRRLEGLLGPLGQFEVYAYGDSDGDAEMLAASDHPAFMPFHKSN